MLFSLIHILRNGFIDFWRNKWVSQATVAVMTITLLTVVSFFMFSSAINSVIDNLKARMDISVYFKIDTNESDILRVKKNLESLEQVKNVKYVSRSDALSLFKRRHQNDPLILQSLEEIGSNPLTASLNIQAKEPAADFPFVSQFLNKNYHALIDKVNYQENKEVISRIGHFSSGVKKAALIITFVLILVVILVTFNTIRLTIYSVRDEIGIMRLVGASNNYIRGPFIVEGAIYGILATLLSTSIAWIIFRILSIKMAPVLLDFNLYQYFSGNIWSIIAIQVAIGIGLGTLGSYVAVRKYLKI